MPSIICNYCDVHDTYDCLYHVYWTRKNYLEIVYKGSEKCKHQYVLHSLIRINLVFETKCF